MRKRLFKHWGFKLPLLLGILMVSMILASGVALAVSSPVADGTMSCFSGQYYNFPIPHPDLEDTSNYAVVTGLVGDTLAPSGLPYLTTLGKTYINQFDWWDSQNLVNTEYNIPALTDPYVEESSWFPTRPTYGKTITAGTVVNNIGTKAPIDWNGYFAVHFKSTINVTTVGDFGFTMGSDDDSWLFVDGKLVLDLGWVHALANTNGSIPLSVGNHTIDIFYAERHTTQAGFYFTTSIPTSIHGGAESFPILSATPSYFEHFGS